MLKRTVLMLCVMSGGLAAMELPKPIENKKSYGPINRIKALTAVVGTGVVLVLVCFTVSTNVATESQPAALVKLNE